MLEYVFTLSPVLLALMAGIITWLFTLLGAGLVVFFKNINKKVMDLMLALAAGLMLAASFWSLLNPGIEMAKIQNQIAPLIASLGFLSGALLIVLSDKIVNKIIKKKTESENSKFKRSLLLIFSITVHNIPEGLAVGLAFGSLTFARTSSALVSAFVFAFGIAVQNFPEGAAISLPLRREGYSRKKAFFYGQLSGIVEPIAAVIGAVLVMKIKVVLPFFLCFAAGAMVYVVTKEIIPESQDNNYKTKAALFTMIGFTIMMVLDVALG